MQSAPLEGSASRDLGDLIQERPQAAQPVRRRRSNPASAKPRCPSGTSSAPITPAGPSRPGRHRPPPFTLT